VPPTRVSYNAVLDAAWGSREGHLLFAQALHNEVYPTLQPESAGLRSKLDLHGMSTGSVRFAVSWFLSELMAGARKGKAVPQYIELVTGWGKSRRVYDVADIRADVAQHLEELGLPYDFLKNQGRIGVDVRQLLPRRGREAGLQQP